MNVDITVPRLAESISDAVLVEWLKQDGERVKADEPVATLETDKAAVEIAAGDDGVLHHARKLGERVQVGDVIARVETTAAGPPANGADAKRASSSSAPAPVPATPPAAAAAPRTTSAPATARAPARAPAGAGAPPPAAATPPAPAAAGTAPASAATTAVKAPAPLSPAVRRMVEEHALDPAAIPATGRDGRLLKEDVRRVVEGERAAPPATEPPPAPARPAGSARPEAGGADERVVPMSAIRQRIAERLVRAQHTAAILTTFNEIDMSAVLALRARHKERFEARHGVKLGFMSFFGRACIHALAEVPELNAEIRGTDLVYRRGVHLGVAVGTERGLVVPVVHGADGLSFAELEREIGRLAERARVNRLSLQELSGGTFTISNGGVYGSLLSTPILNPPQSGILGMHKIEKRPIAVDDAVVIRPMMYVALSYDHRIVDGEQAVTFLVRVKERLEDPERMLLDV